MTCNGCRTEVEDKLNAVDGVAANVNLEKEEVIIEMEKQIPLNVLQKAIPPKYTISEKTKSETVASVTNFDEPESQSKFQQLKPLFLILLYISVASILLNMKNCNTTEAMFDFMGLFYIVFSFFKMLDLKGFPDSFRMYDPLAKKVPVYAKIYPFLETVLGLAFLMRFEVQIALIVTILVLGITTYGVTKTLLDKKSIRCACLGTALKLPMTEATFIENAIMLVMAIIMLF